MTRPKGAAMKRAIPRSLSAGGGDLAPSRERAGVRAQIGARGRRLERRSGVQLAEARPDERHVPVVGDVLDRVRVVDHARVVAHLEAAVAVDEHGALYVAGAAGVE